MFVPEETTLSQPPRKRRVFALAVLILVVIAAAVIYGLSGSSRLERQLADLRSRGLPTNGEELNAWYAVPADVSDTTELWTAATKRAHDVYRTIMKAESIPLISEGLTKVPPAGEEWAELEISRTFLKDLDNEIQMIRDAADAGGMARYPVDFTQGYSGILTDLQQQLRTLAKLSSLSAHVHAHDGQTHEALKDLKSIFAASDSIRGEPILISQLIRIAIHAIGCQLTVDMLPHGKWTDEELQNLQIATGSADFRSEMRTAFHGELVLCLNEIDSSPYPHSMFRSANKSKAIDLWAESTAGLETSWQEALVRQKKVDAELKTMSANSVSRLTYKSLLKIVPGISRCITTGIKAEARQNCCIATIATHRYRLKHGRLPQILTDLKHFIPDEEPSMPFRLIDPFDGQPLRFKARGDGVVIYSIGENRVDDDGDVENKDPEAGDLGYLISE
jgi:hypothetical protein